MTNIFKNNYFNATLCQKVINRLVETFDSRISDLKTKNWVLEQAILNPEKIRYANFKENDLFFKNDILPCIVFEKKNDFVQIYWFNGMSTVSKRETLNILTKEQYIEMTDGIKNIKNSFLK